MAGRKMHQTTVRFGPDLWNEIAAEAELAGVSVAQYVRDAALMRVAYTWGRNAEPHYERARDAIESPAHARLDAARKQTDRNLDSARALVAENAQAVRQARSVRSKAQTTRGRRTEPARPGSRAS